MAQPTLVEFHNAYVHCNSLFYISLCDTFRSPRIKKKYKDTFKLFKPSKEEIKQLRKEGLHTNAWASESKWAEVWKYTPMRETIMLLICAMHNEL